MSKPHPCAQQSAVEPGVQVLFIALCSVTRPTGLPGGQEHQGAPSLPPVKWVISCCSEGLFPRLAGAKVKLYRASGKKKPECKSGLWPR